MLSLCSATLDSSWGSLCHHEMYLNPFFSATATPPSPCWMPQADVFCCLKPHGMKENSLHLLRACAPHWDSKLLCFAKYLWSIFQIIIILRSPLTLPQCIFMKLKARAAPKQLFNIHCSLSKQALDALQPCSSLRAEMLSAAWNKTLFCPGFTHKRNIWRIGNICLSHETVKSY